jgi:hypothetical protein
MNKAPLICTTTEAIAAPELLCHSAHPGPSSAGNVLMFMPGGLQSITPSQGGEAVSVQVFVDSMGAAAIERQRAALAAKGKRPYFDFNHEDRQASFWPESFFWAESPVPGIYAKGEYSEEGRAGVEGKSWRQFSPVFYVDNTAAKPARIVCRSDAKPNMGGLVNDPAFSSILPFWAKSASPARTADGAHPSLHTKKPNTHDMTPEELAALQAKNKQLETELAALQAKETALKAKNENSELVSAQLKAIQAEHRANAATLEVESLKAKNALQDTAIKARNEADAKKCVADAIARGALAAKDQASIDSWTKLITDDPSMAALLAKMAGNPVLTAGRVTAATVVVRASGGKETMQAFGAICAKQGTASSLAEKGKIAKESLAFYAKHIEGNKDILDMPLSAADSTDADLGTMAGTLVAMRTIEDYEQQLIPSQFLTTDYSDVPAQFGQTTATRIVVTPAVMGYDATDGADGRAKGYVLATKAQTVDAPVTLDQHKAVEINFNTQQLGSTVRNLFGEQANLAGYALALDVNAALLANITAGNFPGTAASAASTGTQPVVIQLADFGRPAFAAAAVGFNPLGVPIPGRACIMNSLYYGRLSQDPTLSSLAVFQKPEIITGAELPAISKFQPLEASYLPTTGNLAAFFMHKSALVIQTRVPNDYTNVLPGASFGNVSVITGKSGLSFLLVQYVDHKGAFAGWRIAIMYGTAKGNAKGGMIVKSA